MTPQTERRTAEHTERMRVEQTKRMRKAVEEGDFAQLEYQLRRAGRLSGPPIPTGVCVAIRIPADAQISVGRVRDVGDDWILLAHCSWVDYTGKRTYAAGIAHGATEEGWSSEYEGNVIVLIGPGVKVHLLPDTFVLPETTIHPT